MKNIVLAVLLTTSCLLSAQTRELSFYEIKHTTAPPVIDGKVDDSCWEKANRHTAYYEYFEPNPKPGVLKTEFRMLYDTSGLYLAVINYEENIDAIKKTITDRDNSSLWTDDCAELYFDPHAAGIGFYKFTVNALGTMADIRRIDGAVYLPEWNGNGWFAKASINKDNWSFEAFFPWEDLGEIGRAGDLWTFCHTRYSFVGNKFRGVTSAPGANYNATSNFGYLYFSEPGQNISHKKLAELLEAKISPPWSLNTGNTVIINFSSGIQIVSMEQLVYGEREAIEKLIAETNKISTDNNHDMEKLVVEYRNIKNADYRLLAEIRGKFDQLKWKAKLNTIFNQ